MYITNENRDLLGTSLTSFEIAIKSINSNTITKDVLLNIKYKNLNGINSFFVDEDAKKPTTLDLAATLLIHIAIIKNFKSKEEIAFCREIISQYENFKKLSSVNNDADSMMLSLFLMVVHNQLELRNMEIEKDIIVWLKSNILKGVFLHNRCFNMHLIDMILPLLVENNFKNLIKCFLDDYHKELGKSYGFKEIDIEKMIHINGVVKIGDLHYHLLPPVMLDTRRNRFDMNALSGSGRVFT